MFFLYFVFSNPNKMSWSSPHAPRIAPICCLSSSVGEDAGFSGPGNNKLLRSGEQLDTANDKDKKKKRLETWGRAVCCFCSKRKSRGNCWFFGPTWRKLFFFRFCFMEHRPVIRLQGWERTGKHTCAGMNMKTHHNEYPYTCRNVWRAITL